MDPTKEDDISPGGGSLVGKAEGIAQVVCHALDWLDLIVVREDDRVAAPL